MKAVLYAEDNPDDVFLMRLVWERARIANPLFHARDGRQAADYLEGIGDFADRQKYPLPGLLLLDLKMPGVSGFDLLRWIRQHPSLNSLRVVIVSASNLERDVSAAQDLGVTDYVVKSPRLKTLLEVIQEKKRFWLEEDEE